MRLRCEALDDRLIATWPRDTKVAQRCFELLRQAYVNARYSPHYKITAEELAFISERIAVLQGLLETICSERLDG